jgi:hypothetical protein
MNEPGNLSVPSKCYKTPPGGKHLKYAAVKVLMTVKHARKEISKANGHFKSHIPVWSAQGGLLQ